MCGGHRAQACRIRAFVLQSSCSRRAVVVRSSCACSRMPCSRPCIACSASIAIWAMLAWHRSNLPNFRPSLLFCRVDVDGGGRTPWAPGRDASAWLEDTKGRGGVGARAGRNVVHVQSSARNGDLDVGHRICAVRRQQRSLGRCGPGGAEKSLGLMERAIRQFGARIRTSAIENGHASLKAAGGPHKSASDEELGSHQHTRCCW